MAPQFLKQLIGILCPHRFSWPRSGLHGQDYQVCLICGATYRYSWATMCRTGRLEAPPDAGQEPLPESSPLIKEINRSTSRL